MKVAVKKYQIMAYKIEEESIESVEKISIIL